MMNFDDLFVMIRSEKYQKQCNKLWYALNSYTNIAGKKLADMTLRQTTQWWHLNNEDRECNILIVSV